MRGAMVAVWRGLVWIVGSVSVAVLLVRAFDTPLAPPLRPAADAYDAAIAQILSPLAPWLSALLGSVNGLAGSGALLHPHWTHIFVAASLHMAPRVDATFGVGGVAAGVLWCLQLTGAMVLAAILAVYVASVPAFAVPNSAAGFVVGVFLAAAAWISALANWQDVEMPDDERAEKAEANARWWTLDSIISGYSVAFVLAMICAGMVALMMGWLDAETARMLLVLVVVLWVLVVAVRWLVMLSFEPDDPDDGFLRAGGLATTIAWSAIVVAAAILADTLSLRSGALPVGLALALAAVPIVGAYYLADVGISRLTGRSPDAGGRAATPALGMFIIGGGAILVASWALAA